MSKIILLIVITSIINANTLSLVDDTIKYIKGGKSLSTLDNTNNIIKVGRLSKVTQVDLTLSKTANIQNLMSLAVKENKINFNEQFKYIKIFKNIENGDKILLRCLKDSTCNLDSYSKLMQNSPSHVQVFTKKVVDTTKIIGARAAMKVSGVMNDFKIYPIKNSKGKVIGNYQPTYFYDTSKTIQMPSVIFAVGSKTSTGYLRNSKIYWTRYAEKYRSDLSSNNLMLIKQNKSPIVDDTWIKAHPSHKSFRGDVLEHHHLHHNGETVPLPVTLHRLQDNKKVFHSM